VPKVRNPESVFLSYAIGDKPRMGRVLKELRTRGLLGARDEIVHPTQVTVPGSSIRGVLRNAIQSASKVVLVWSGAGSASQWVNYEAGMAEALGKPIIVVVAKGQASSVPANLKDVQVIEVPGDG
jgi:hypothetical protein